MSFAKILQSEPVLIEKDGSLSIVMAQTNPQIVLITYADSAYIQSARSLAERAKILGFHDIRIIEPIDLDSEFVARNNKTLKLHRGAGYWIWKPWIISETLKTLNEDQSLLYCDAGTMLRSSATYFEDASSDGLIHLWSLASHRNSNRYWIDQTVWREIVGTNEVNESPHYWAGMILGKNNWRFRKIVTEWLELCEKELYLHPDSKKDYVPTPGLIGHRHDQSILNCILTLNPSCFNLTSLNHESITSPVILHRRGNVRSYTEANLIMCLGLLYRRFLSFMPRALRLKMYKSLTIRRRPHVSEVEIQRHLDNFF